MGARRVFLSRDDVLRLRATAQFHATYSWFSWAPLSPAPQASGNIATWTPSSICPMPQSDQSATWMPSSKCPMPSSPSFEAASEDEPSLVDAAPSPTLVASDCSSPTPTVWYPPTPLAACDSCGQAPGCQLVPGAVAFCEERFLLESSSEHLALCVE